MNKRIVNCRFVCCGLHFDAAIDCDWELHCYGQTEEEKRDATPIELYCFDHKEWDIRMIYHKERNDQQGVFSDGLILHSSIDFQEILKETRKWIKEQGL